MPDEHGSSDPKRVSLALLITAALMGPAAVDAKQPDGKADHGRDGKADRGPKGHEAQPPRAEGPGDPANQAPEPPKGEAKREAKDRPHREPTQGKAPRDEPRHHPTPAEPRSNDRAPAPAPPPAPEPRCEPAPVAPAPAPTAAAPGARPEPATPAAADPRPQPLAKALAPAGGAGGGTILAATLSDNPMDAPPLTPLPELAEQQAQPGPGRPAAAQVTLTRRSTSQGPSLPFSGFSVLTLLLAGAAAISTGRRLQLLTEPPGGGAADPAGAGALEPPPALALAPAPRIAAAPAHENHRPRTAIYVGVALLGLAALTAARARTA